jgi:hypothetical protein
MRVPIDRPRLTLDFDKHQACRSKDEQIDLVDTPLVVHEFEVRPCPPGVVVWQVLAEELQSLAFPLVCGGANNCPTRWLHAFLVLTNRVGRAHGRAKPTVVNEQVPVTALTGNGLPRSRTSEWGALSGHFSDFSVLPDPRRPRVRQNLKPRMLATRGQRWFPASTIRAVHPYLDPIHRCGESLIDNRPRGCRAAAPVGLLAWAMSR